MADEITLDAPETRLERFLAAAAGMDGITLDEPETRVEKYLYKIAQGSGGVPAVEDADKGKYLHANESTGDLEWAAPGGGGGGGVLVCTVDESNTLDHTWKEISEAPTAIAKSPITPGIYYLTGVIGIGGNHIVVFSTVAEGKVIDMLFSTDSENGYPVMQQG